MSFPEPPYGCYTVWDRAHQPHQPTFNLTSSNPGYGGEHSTAPYPPYQGPSRYGPIQAPNYRPPGGVGYYPTAPQVPYPPYGGYYPVSQGHTNPKPYYRDGPSRYAHSYRANRHEASTPHSQYRPANRPQQHPRAPTPTSFETPASVHRHPSNNNTQSSQNPTVGPTASYQLAPTLIPNVSQYPSIDWDITLPVESAQLLTSPKGRTEVDFSRLAVYPPVRTVSIVARKVATPLGLALEHWGPIDVKSDKPLTIGDILNGIRIYFDTPIHSDEKRRLDKSLLEKARVSNEKRWNAQVYDREVWPELAHRAMRRADTLFDNFQYGGLWLDEDFQRNRKIELTLENPLLEYLMEDSD